MLGEMEFYLVEWDGDGACKRGFCWYCTTMDFRHRLLKG
jgi:hypothetical protein